MQAAAGFQYPAFGYYFFPNARIEVRHFQIGSYHPVIIGNERDAGEAGNQVGHGGNNAAVGEATLLLVNKLQGKFSFDAAGLNEREVGPDVVHKLLAGELLPDSGD